MNRPLRIAHTSDVHLDDGEDAAHAREAFERVIDAVRHVRAELFLIAGDLFDHNRVKGSVIDFVSAQLSRITCPTVIIAGNHDCWEERSVLRRLDARRPGSHVTLLSGAEGTSVELTDLHATVWGRSMREHDLANKPMAGAPPRTRDFWHIGMAHGLFSNDEDIGRSSLISAAEIEASGFDFLALGHVHVHRQMRHGRTLACYPGVPAPRFGTAAHGMFNVVELVPGRRAQAKAYELSSGGAGHERDSR